MKGVTGQQNSWKIWLKWGTSDHASQLRSCNCYTAHLLCLGIDYILPDTYYYCIYQFLWKYIWTTITDVYDVAKHISCTDTESYTLLSYLCTKVTQKSDGIMCGTKYYIVSFTFWRVLLLICLVHWVTTIMILFRALTLFTAHVSFLGETVY